MLDNIFNKQENAKNILLEGVITSEELKTTLTNLDVEKRTLLTRLNELEYQSKNLLTINNACNGFNYNSEEYKKISHYVRYQHIWDKLPREKKQIIISRYIDNIIVSSKTKKDVQIKNIQIKENMFAKFSYKFRYDIFKSHLIKEEQQAIIESHSYERTQLLNYYKVIINDFKGIKVNINDTLETLLIAPIETENMLITI